MADNNENISLEDVLKALNWVLENLGDVSLSKAKSWAEVEQNALALRAEGHEDEAENG